jgi:hypothetical protein
LQRRWDTGWKRAGHREGRGTSWATSRGRARRTGTLATLFQGDYVKAIKYHWQDLIIAKEVGNRAGEGKVYEELGNTYSSKGDFSKAIKYHRQLRKVLFIKLVLIQ